MRVPLLNPLLTPLLGFLGPFFGNFMLFRGYFGLKFAFFTVFDRNHAFLARFSRDSANFRFHRSFEIFGLPSMFRALLYRVTIAAVSFDV